MIPNCTNPTHVARGKVQMSELLPSELQAVENPQASVEIVKNVSIGQEFLVLPSFRPQILDVTCHDLAETYTWSRITGDLQRKGQVAFNLNPVDGSLSGTPDLDLSHKGQGSLDIHCSIALGGRGHRYDKVLPLLNFTVKLLADVCFVPDLIPAPSLWSKWKSKDCFVKCRKMPDCAAVNYQNNTCMLLVASNISNETEEIAHNVSAMVRLENCSEDETSLELLAPQAGYVQGTFQPSNVYKSDVSYARSGNTVERQLVFVRNEAG